MTTQSPRRRRWRSGWPLDVGAVLGPLHRGRHDPTARAEPTGARWRATRTPDGPATLSIRVRPGLGEVDARAWGPGADWVLDGLPGLLGADDDPCGLRAPPRRDPRDVAPTPGLAGAAHPPGPRVAGARGARAEGHRPRGLAGVRIAGPTVRRAGSGSGRPSRRRSVGAAGRADLGDGPVVALAPRGRGPGALARRRDSGRLRRSARGALRPPPGRGRDAHALPARSRRVDRRRGRAARARRCGRRVGR